MINILETDDHRFPKFDVEYDGKVVGRAIVFMRFHPYQHKPVLEVLELFVHPEHRKKGIAKALVHRVVDYAAQQDCLAVHLVTDDWDMAQRLYVRGGFEENKEARNYICLLDKKISKE